MTGNKNANNKSADFFVHNIESFLNNDVFYVYSITKMHKMTLIFRYRDQYGFSTNLKSTGDE